MKRVLFLLYTIVLTVRVRRQYSALFNLNRASIWDSKPLKFNLKCQLSNIESPNQFLADTAPWWCFPGTASVTQAET